MPLTVGVIGPEDLVRRVVAYGGGTGTGAAARAGGSDAGFTRPRLLPVPYGHEDETGEAVLRARGSRADALLFTGVVPHARADAEGLLDRPALYVPYSGATLLRALVGLLRRGHDVSRVSIDTLRRADVRDTLAEAELPTDGVRVLPYRPGLTSRDLVAFHRDARDAHGCRVAITCLGSAYRALAADEGTHAVRLAPSRHSISATLRALVLATEGLRGGDAQVALGILDLPPGEDVLPAECAAVLGGSLAELPDGRRLVVTTRGALDKATDGFTRLPFPADASSCHGPAHFGFGLGRTAADAEALARRALNRARAVGPTAGVVSLPDDVDFVLSTGSAAWGTAGTAVAHRVGLSPVTVDRLRELAAAGPAGAGVTAQLVADHLSVQPRTARRILKRLERAGAAVPVGSLQQGRTGRPPTVYRFHL
ncbi:hypothetical protein [Streptomyces sp. TRM64462]|uniref:hypothetical protein n=1 Tax=Streptomyces sp. TRM64462 TaxID=2741726 RepID=UPI00158640FD|nr:hypothetical protein [Streptomyces sp. TRM64462]